MYKIIFLLSFLFTSLAAQAQSIGSNRIEYVFTPVTTSAWTQVSPGFAQNVSHISIFDSCGQTLELGTGPIGSEVHQIYIPPGGFDAPQPLQIIGTTRIAIRAVSGNCNAASTESIINFY